MASDDPHGGTTPIEPGTIGGGRADRPLAVVDGLSRLLADTYTLYLKTQNYHWNVTGPMFPTLHALFEAQYRELALAVDQVAERIRVLGARAPASYGEFARCSSIHEDDDRPDATEMIRRLAEGHEAVILTAASVGRALEATDDAPSADLVTQRIAAHEAAAWMLRSTLA
jgi:starvation-inducible DNA-binding protein